MSKIKAFIDDLDDYELAFFAKYKSASYIPETRKEIKKLLSERGLTYDKVERLIAVNPQKESKQGKQRCPRCSTDKVRIEKIEWVNNTDEIGIEDAVASVDGLNGKATFKNKVICNVCEFNIENPNSEIKKRSFWHVIADGIFHMFTGS